MLPESKFPVTGGIMQTEEVLPRAHSTELDATVSESKSSFLHPEIKFTQHYSPSASSFTNMAVKQEPQEEDEHSRLSNKFSQKAETDNAQSISDGSPNHIEREIKQSVPELDNAESPGSLQNGSKKIPNRGRRKSRWKLKFHHQALPPEYLDHYEAAMAQETALKSPASTDSLITSPLPTSSAPAFKPAAADVQSWLQHLAAMQNNIYTHPLQTYQPQAANVCQTTASRRSVITSTQLPQSPSFGHQQFKFHQQKQPQIHNSSQRNNAQPSPRPPMKYSDLPYMGEITLDNSKPRRGRKPKKADICHLIYKNYGTILPGTPGLEDHAKSQAARDKADPGNVQLPMSFQRTDIQNRISSLLEKRLTQEKRALELSVDLTKEQEEPLNLCIRDLNLLKIRLNDKYNGALKSYNAKSEESSDAEDVNSSASGTNAADTELSVDSNSENNNLKRMGVNNNNSDNLETSNGSNNDVLNNNDPRLKKSPDLLYWPNTGVFIHPAALQSQLMYYQKLAQDKGLTTSPEQGPKEPRIVPKSIYSLLETPNPAAAANSTDSSSAETPETVSTPSPRPKRNSTSQSGPAPNQPVKRKRSAIFIPPMPTENNSNPATEVSICKFKFTGGAKPTLQEKKSLSVDSGGNFRYYSGTGDKSMRGYEFFPRETLQQPASQAGGSSTGAFLNAAAERVPQAVCPREFGNLADDSKRKRKTRKSVQREKLEQTFKEKGFLIQTQQLESAEGATYCKFRQLRKFTRYLFRSWKDYLPGNVRELNESGEPIGSLKDIEQDLESLPVSPSPSSNPEFQQNFMEPNSPQSLSLN